MALHIDIVSSVCDQVAAWQQAFLGEANLDRFRRAAAWTMSEVAKGAAGGAKGAVEDAFENPTPWMRAAFGYQRALTRSGDEISAELFVKPSQSIVLKYALGDGVQTRRPGEVGLARERILVPHWRNLALTQGINRNSYGNLPGGVAARLAREAAGTTAKRRVAGRWGVYRGELDVGGSRITGYIARPGARRPSARAAARSSSTSAGLGHCSSPSTRRGTAPSFRQAHGRRVAQLEQDADHRHECSKVQARPNDSICARS